MCVHATIAAVTALTSAGILGGQHAIMRTASGEPAVRWGTGEPPEVTVEQNPPGIPAPAAGVGAVHDRPGRRDGSAEFAAGCRAGRPVGYRPH